MGDILYPFYGTLNCIDTFDNQAVTRRVEQWRVSISLSMGKTIIIE